MARLIIRKELLQRLSKRGELAHKVFRLAADFAKFTEEELKLHPNIKLEPHINSRDPNARTARLDDNHRAILWDAGDHNTYFMMDYGTHDETDRYMRDRILRVNETRGDLEFIDVAVIEDAREAVSSAVSEASPLFGHRRDRDFTNLGIDNAWMPVLRTLLTEDELQSFLEAAILDDGSPIVDVLVGLMGEEPVDEIYERVTGNRRLAIVNPTDLLSAAEAPGSRANYFVVTDDDELRDWLDKPFSLWRTYLHHSQHDAAYTATYDGPALVTGPAGTGKTVAALHRAKFLAEQLPEAAAKQILFTTFHVGLAKVIERDLGILGGPELTDAVEVLNIDWLSKRILEGSPEGELTPISDDDALKIWEDLVVDADTGSSAQLLQAEWEHVILARPCRNREEYRELDRSSGGIELSFAERSEFWECCEEFERRLTERGETTYSQMAALAADKVLVDRVPRYRHVIVDETQDLLQTQLRLLRVLVAEGPNDLFFAGDGGQRIYDRRASLKESGIDVAGRETNLWVNYRTSSEIAAWASAVDVSERELDLGVPGRRSPARLQSLLRGPEPICVETTSASELSEHLALQVADWIDKEVAPQDIAIASRSKVSHPIINAALSSAQIDFWVYQPGGERREGVRVSTMHSLKGLEFRCVALFDINDERLPASWLLEIEDLESSEREQVLKREQRLLYMAATRPREELWVGWSGTSSRFLKTVLETDDN